MTKCEKCGESAQHNCPVCGENICVDDSVLSVICKNHYKSKRIQKNIKVRNATKKDEKVLEEIEDSVIWEHIKSDRYAQGSYSSKAWKSIKSNTLVAEINRKVVGFVEYARGIDPHEEPAMTVTDLGVLPEHQNAGVGYKIFDKLKEIAKSEGFGKIYVSSTSDNIPALMFHLKNGAKIFSIKETGSKKIGRWGIPTNYDFSFVYEV